MILIGISSAFFYPDPNRDVYGPKRLAYMVDDIWQYILRDDVMPVLIPSANKNYLSKVDGFVLQGGSDISPGMYNEHYPEKPGDPERDAYEWEIIDYALKTNKPLLGICRGFQMINVYFGGTLYQDLSTQREGSLKHRCRDEYDRLSHEIQIQPNGILNTLYPENIRVNSVHNQGVKTPGKNLRVEAICPEDGLVEAFSTNDGHVIGVQWHPEFAHSLKGEISSPEPLIEYYINKVRSTR